MGEDRLPVTPATGAKAMARCGAWIFGGVVLLAAGTSGADAQQWLLNSGASHFYMQTVKANSIFENHQFKNLDGTITPDGNATVKIDLTSVISGIDVRDVRMRFLLFETFKFPNAEVTAKLDMAKLQELRKTTRIDYPLKFKLNLHGIEQEMEAPVTVTRVSDKSISVASAAPIIVTADSFGLTAGIAKLSEAVNGTQIATGASITFDLVFETGDKIPAIEAARAATARQKAQDESSAIAPEACETRFSVISTTGAIYFKTGSAEIDTASDALLDSVAQIANRCPAVRIQVAGHTDAVGSRESNRRLSTLRARSVADYLIRQGVSDGRIDSAGYGDSRPVAPNDTEAGRAKNRRIEFAVKSQ
jgi:OmpA-OmpF porin, OOP family